MRRSLLSALCLLLIATPSLAHERAGRIEGTIYDDEGNPLGGAIVTATSPTQIGGVRKTTTDEEGGFAFIDLTPGKFVVAIRAEGFVGAKRKDVRVNLGRTVTLDILLDRAVTPQKAPPARAAAGSQPSSRAASQPSASQPSAEVIMPDGRRAKARTYVIKAARPVVDVTKATTGESLSDEYMENMPVSGRSYQGVAGMTRGVTQQRNPKEGGAGNPSVSGGAYFNNTYTVDGVDTTDPVTHTFGTNFNFDAMSDVNVMTGAMGAEYSDTPGGLINMVTKSGSNRFQLDSSIYYQDDALTIKRPEEEGNAFSSLDFNVNVGGPIKKDKLWYFASLELNRRISTLPPDPNGLLVDHPRRLFEQVRGLLKFTWQPLTRHRFSAWVQTSHASIDNSRQLITVEPEAESHQNQHTVVSAIAWDYLISSRLFLKSQFSLSWQRLDVFPQIGDASTAAVGDSGTGVASRNYSRRLLDDRWRIALNSSATYFRKNKRYGDHEAKLGFRFNHVRNPSTESINGNQIFNNNFGQPASLTRYFLSYDEVTACDSTAPGYDPQKCQQGELKTSVSGNKLILFAQDQWKLPGYKRLRITPGVALHFGNSQNPDGETVTSFVAPTAHLNAAWDLFGNGKTVVRGGYNQYVDTGFLSIARFIGRDHITQTCNWDPDTRSYSLNCRIGGQTRTVGVPQPEFDAEGKVKDKFNPAALSVPRVHEFTLGAEHEWFSGFSTGMDFQYRYYGNQWEDLETNVLWNEVGDNADGFKNGKSEFIFDLETPEQAYRRYIGLSFFLRKFVGNWQLMASYTWSRNEGTVAEGFATAFLDRPRQVDFFDGFLPDDRRHVVKVTGFYSWRQILTFGGSFWLGTGTPYDRLYFNSFFNDYADRRAPRGYDPRDLSTPADDIVLRTPTRLQIDLKVTWNMQHLTKRWFGESHRLELVGELFNAFNLRTATRYEDRNLAPGAPTQWGDVIDRQDPFLVRFGLRYRY